MQPLKLKLNVPSTHTSTAPENPPPPTDFLIGTWHVTHSSLPLWKSKRNVKITYTPLPCNTSKGANTTPSLNPDAEPNPNPKLDDRVTYQEEKSPKIKSVHGIDTPSPGIPGAWDWRGKGWLVIASSHWECLGWGDCKPHTTPGDTEDGSDKAGDGYENQWMVTYFAKTLFTPAGIDIYSRKKEGLPGAVVEEILGALRGFGIEEITELVGGVFQIPQDSWQV